MRYFDIIRTANTNLRKSKLRTFLTISAVFIGTLTLMLTTGVGAGLKTYVEEQVGSVGAKDVLFISLDTGSGNPFGSDVKEYDPERVSSSALGITQGLLVQRDVDKIAATPGIKSVLPLYPTSADYITASGKKYIAIVTQTVDGLIQPMRVGRMVNQNGSEFEVTLPPEFVGPLGFADSKAALGKKLTVGFTDGIGRPFTRDATIVGVQEKALVNGNQTTANLAFIKSVHAQTTASLGPLRQAQYPNVFAKFDASMSKSDLDQLKQRLKDQKYGAVTLEDQLGIIKTIIGGIITFLNIFAAITLAAATFGIVNTLLMAVQERTREIGLMKALGMSRRKIFALFSFEAILIGFWGSIIALGAANILGRIGSKVASRTVFKDFEGLQLFSFPARSVIPVILLIMLIAFIAATLPARRAARLDAIEALRYE